jgi:hypothetical protein
MRICLITVKPGINVTVPEREDAFNYSPKENDWIPVLSLDPFIFGGRLAHKIITDSTDIWIDLFNEFNIKNPCRTVIKHETLESLSAFLFITQSPWYLSGGYGREEIEI